MLPRTIKNSPAAVPFISKGVFFFFRRTMPHTVETATLS